MIRGSLVHMSFLVAVQRCMIEQLAAQAAVPTSIHRVTIPDSHNWLASSVIGQNQSEPLLNTGTGYTELRG